MKERDWKRRWDMSGKMHIFNELQLMTNELVEKKRIIQKRVTKDQLAHMPS